ncbi:MAG: ABC transporter permease [Longimicrobiales bacterium]|nr:ABC transporter permease [Longimicrobiales bacterium]
MQKEFSQVLRDRLFLMQLIVPPFVQLLIVTSAATFEVRSLDLHLVDRDQSPASRSLVDAFTASGRFEMARRSASDEAADRDLVQDRVGGVLSIPRGFGEELGRGGTATVHLVFDGSDGATAGVARSYAEQILADFGAAPATPDLRIVTQAWYNPDHDYDDYMAPGILVILITIVGTVTTALNIAREKEQGTIEQLNVTPITRGQFVAGKLAPFLLLGILELAFGLFLAWIVYDIPFRGSLLLVFAGGGLYLLSALGLGLIISTASDTQQQAQFLAFFLMVIYLFLSGIFTPVESMPEWARMLAEMNPMKHFVALVRAILLRGAGVPQVATELWALTALAVVTLPMAVALHRKRTA